MAVDPLHVGQLQSEVTALRRDIERQQATITDMDQDIKRLLAEKPDARGLVLPGMPLGSPGMETPQGHKDPYDTLLVLRSGATQVFARHNPPT